MVSLPRFRAGPAAALLLTLALAACQQAPAPKAPAAPAPVPAPPGAVAPPVATAPPRVALPSTDLPPGPMYYCVAAGQRTPIDYEPRVEQLCRRHPEMGPCQYERNACRARQGRVFTARGEEVSPAVEAEYDRVVMRVRFPGDTGAGAKR